VVMLSYYPLGAQVLTVVLQLGWFIVVMIAMFVVFTRPHTVPGHRPVAGARAVAPASATAAATAAATGFPTATSSAGTEPLADRSTPPVVGARADEAAAEEPADSSTDEAASDEAPETGKPEDSE
jgi:hypothetical protein